MKEKLPKILRVLLITAITIGSLILLVILAGIIKFNFSDKDIHYSSVLPNNSVNSSSTINAVTASTTLGLPAESKYFGNEIKGDFNGDGINDAAFLVTQDPGGSGTFYYIMAALGTKNAYTDTNAILLGDRIAPQTTEFKDGEIIVNYADRKLDEPFSVKPSVGVSKYFKVNNGVLVEVLK